MCCFRSSFASRRERQVQKWGWAGRRAKCDFRGGWRTCLDGSSMSSSLHENNLNQILMWMYPQTQEAQIRTRGTKRSETHASRLQTCWRLSARIVRPLRRTSWSFFGTMDTSSTTQTITIPRSRVCGASSAFSLARLPTWQEERQPRLPPEGWHRSKAQPLRHLNDIWERRKAAPYRAHGRELHSPVLQSTRTLPLWY